MAANNHYSVVNATGQNLTVNINGQSTTLPVNSYYSGWMQFPVSGESIDVQIQMDGSNAQQTIAVNGGVDSYTILQFCNNGWVNIFPSNVNDRVAI